MSAVSFEIKMKFLAALIADPNLSAAAKVVAVPLIVTFHNNKTGRCNPSYDALATAVGRSRRAVIPTVLELREAGWIEIATTGGGGRGNTNRIGFCFDRAPETVKSAALFPASETVKDAAPFMDETVKYASPFDTTERVKRTSRVKYAARVKCSVVKGEAHRTRTSEEPLISILTDRSLSEGPSQGNEISLDVQARPAIGSPTEKKLRKKALRSVDPDLQPTERDVAAAVARGMPAAQVPAQWARFIDWHTAKGSLMADWPAAWRTWAGNYKPFDRTAPGIERSSPAQQRMSGRASAIAGARSLLTDEDFQ